MSKGIVLNGVIYETLSYKSAFTAVLMDTFKKYPWLSFFSISTVFSFILW